MSPKPNHSPEKHGVVLDGHDVKRIKEELARLQPAEIRAFVDRLEASAPGLLRYPAQVGAYEAAVETANRIIARILDGADLSCAKCPDDCMQTARVCSQCGHEGSPGDPVNVIVDGDDGPEWLCWDEKNCRLRGRRILAEDVDRPLPASWIPLRRCRRAT